MKGLGLYQDLFYFHQVNTTPFFDYLTSEKRSSVHTVSAYRSDIGQFEEFMQLHFEIAEIASVNSTHVRSWISELMTQEISERSIHRKLSALNAWFRFLLKRKEISVNPAKGVTKPKRPSRLPETLQEQQGLDLYRLEDTEISSEKENALLIQLFYETGIRLSEMMGLKHKDIDFGIGQIKVLGKRNKVRYVPVNDDMIQKLKRHMVESHSIGADSALFQNEKGQALSRSSFYRKVKSALSLVTTQKKKSPHVLRHSFATHMLNNGADLNHIKEILGHANLAATQVYTHLSTDRLKRIHAHLHPRENKPPKN
ncbi:MAG: tyrosine-type recombinase/integrase [Flavobacteriales bacterium]|nr:tyrosine-type recombinase/integrase [Flavobacteriales bacterium]MDP4716927.1 tyrosine-type recombinase/integrase [Flavobacteriales bacterium]MDP4731327.1 tyrosine-type recombinase/integrase [Flavobacteriales bacterium]MDP4818764.1 tyrosine-type recombinase/integrase [Flavobacteriales bacterium]